MTDIKYILVGSALFNWSETQRMIEIADELTKRGFQIVFIGDGKYDFLLNNKQFIRESIIEDKIWYTEDRISKMLEMDVYGNNYASVEEINSIVSAEINLIQKYNPVLILTGYRMSLSVSAKITRIPIVWCLSATLSKMYLSKIMEIADNACSNKKLISEYRDIRVQYENKLACSRLLYSCKTSQTWNEVLTRYGTEPFVSDLDIYTGDLNLMSDPKELFKNIMETSAYHFIGPIMNNEIIKMPVNVEKVLNKNNGRKKY